MAVRNPNRVRFTIWDPLSKKLIEVERKGKAFSIGGRYVKLFPVGTLAEALGRTVRTVTDWERKEMFPKPLYNVVGSSYTRWYSDTQIKALNKIWLKYRAMGKGPHFDRMAFLQEIADIFYTVDVQKAEQEDNEEFKKRNSGA